MAKLTRITNKIFGENATATGDDPNIGQFGSALAGTFNGTTDVATIQSLPAWGQGWIGAVTPTQQFPSLPEMTGAMKVLSYQGAYNQQMGIPEWDSATTYYTNSFCQYNGVVYKSKIDDNQANTPSDTSTQWEKYGTAEWGKITGTLSNQTDLQTALNNKQNKLTAGTNISLSSEGTIAVSKTIPDTTSSVTSGSTAALTSGGAYTNLVRRASTTSATGSTTKPVYINASGQPAVITSYEGNSATATKATQDSSGNQINTSYQPLKYSKYAISTYASTNPYIKLASVTFSDVTNYDISNLFWVESLQANTSKSYALVRLSVRWSGTSFSGTKFEILEKYGDKTDVFNSLVFAYKYSTASSKASIIGEIWMTTGTNSYNTYYLRPTQCNEYGNFSNTPITMASNPWTYYDKSGTSASIASTEITSGYTQVKVTDGSHRNGLPIGTIFSVACSSSYVPDGALACDGTQYNSTQFSDFYTNFLVGGKLNTCTLTEYASDISTYGQCGRFGLDTTNKVFKVPTIKDGSYITQAMSNSELGKVYNESLPNITGTFRIETTDRANPTEAFYETTGTSKSGMLSTGAGTGTSYLGFDASLSSSTYQDGAKVQGDNVRMRYFVQVANGQINSSQMDWSSWASSLTAKLNTDHSNDTKPYLKETYINGTSGYNIWSNGYCEQWGQAAQADPASITLIKTYADTDYNILAFVRNGDAHSGANQFYIKNTITSGSVFTIAIYGVDAHSGYLGWKTSGYLASGQY